MNYIKQLQAANDAQKQTLTNLEIEINDFLRFLQSDKFTGVESDGGRKDWISTGDVIHQLMNFRSTIQDSRK